MATAQTEMPVPRFAIGDTIYTASIESVAKTLDCPDCLGTREWKITTPAGTELTCACQRCTKGYTNTGLPSLTYQAWAPSVQPKIVGAVEVRWPVSSGWYESPVRYLQGPGGGWVVDEAKVYADREAALAEAERLAAEKNEAVEASADVLEKRRVSVLLMQEARFDQFKNGLWDAWYAYRQMREAIDDLLSDENSHLSAADIHTSLEEAIEWSPGERNLPALTAIVERARKHDDFADLTAKLPQVQTDALIAG